jgi:hypothetical protein
MRAEYVDPADRRFHAEPVACADCGPRLSMELTEAIAALEAGQVLAIKGSFRITVMPQPRLVEVRQKVLNKNDAAARILRERFQDAGGCVILERVLSLLRTDFRVAALVVILLPITTWHAGAQPCSRQTDFHWHYLPSRREHGEQFDAAAAHRNIDAVRPGIPIFKSSVKTETRLQEILTWIKSFRLLRNSGSCESSSGNS